MSELPHQPLLPADGQGCPLCTLRWRAEAAAAAAAVAAAVTAAAVAATNGGASSAAAAAAAVAPASGVRTGAWPCFTPCDVVAHSTAGNVWLSANGRVYDVTPFLSDHPGGSKSIRNRAGRDASVDMEFHSQAAQRRWKTFQVGVLVGCAEYAGAREGCRKGGCAVQ